MRVEVVARTTGMELINQQWNWREKQAFAQKACRKGYAVYYAWAAALARRRIG